jgi:YD repeat-containing protein
METAATPTSTAYYDALGNAVASKDTGGAFSYKIYDALGRVIYEIDAGRFVTAHTYDAFGNQLTLTRFASPLGEGLFTAREAQATATSIQVLTVADVLGPQPSFTQDFSANAPASPGITPADVRVGRAAGDDGFCGDAAFPTCRHPAIPSQARPSIPEITTTTGAGS